MRAPCNGRGFKKCCFCCNLDPDYVCYLIGAICIAFVGFGGLTFLGLGSWFEFALSVVGFFYYSTAGLCLILGTLYMNRNAKIVYCWMMLLGIIFVLIAAICAWMSIASGRRDYSFLTEDCTNCLTAMYIAFFLQFLFLLIFSIYTPLVVLGHLDSYRMPPPQN